MDATDFGTKITFTCCDVMSLGLNHLQWQAPRLHEWLPRQNEWLPRNDANNEKLMK
jgi:hypothetical protein